MLLPKGLLEAARGFTLHDQLCAFAITIMPSLPLKNPPKAQLTFHLLPKQRQNAFKTLGNSLGWAGSYWKDYLMCVSPTSYSYAHPRPSGEP